ncbi:hypothetical protein EIP91_006106 [Steccherinum ochraceum]|uniref:Uncharacterized protein n=1 Tax=Steccherinum ochraceum TaxID=92696 RepID=A0A4R0RRD1_9APHY|nr:hypothetical protein EIP91_006106 [Steccherinum ochraceum]
MFPESTLDQFPTLSYFQSLRTAPAPPPSDHRIAPNMPADHTACWNLVDAYKNGETSHLTAAEYQYMLHYTGKVSPRVWKNTRTIFKYKTRRAIPTTFKEIFVPKYENAWVKTPVGQVTGVGHEHYYLDMLIDLQEAKETDALRLHSVSHIPMTSELQNYRGPALVDLTQADRDYDLKYRSVLQKA